jgi:hypothetical protein
VRVHDDVAFLKVRQHLSDGVVDGLARFDHDLRRAKKGRQFRDNVGVRTRTMALRGSLSALANEAKSWQPTMFLPLPRPLTNSSTLEAEREREKKKKREEKKKKKIEFFFLRNDGKRTGAIEDRDLEPLGLQIEHQILAHDRNANQANIARHR